jgi:hypothetical protein
MDLDETTADRMSRWTEYLRSQRVEPALLVGYRPTATATGFEVIVLAPPEADVLELFDRAAAVLRARGADRV